MEICIFRNFQGKDFSFDCDTHFFFFSYQRKPSLRQIWFIPPFKQASEAERAGQVRKVHLRTTSSSRMTLSRTTADV